MNTTLEILLWVGAALWAVMFVQGLINLMLVRDLSQIEVASPSRWPFVSIIVPARNEQARVRQAVSSFCAQDYPAYEVLVVEDRSTDDTPRILADLQGKFPNLRVIAGREPPEGWLGKLHALETARRSANGEWLLLVDADVVHAPDLLRRGVAYAMAEQAAMLSLRPRFGTRGVLEAALMSSINYFFFFSTPLFLVRYSKGKWIASGSGVFNLIRRDALEACGAFESIRNEVLDDVAIGYRIKNAGFRVAVACAGPLIRFRMYDGAGETIRGFSKNAYPTLRKVPLAMPACVAVGAVTSLLPYYGLGASMLRGSPSTAAIASLALMHAVFGMIAVRFREPWYVTFLNPVREIGWWWIFLRSWWIYHRQGVVWRGRAYTSV